MNRSFSSFSPRVKPLNYDTLGNRVGIGYRPVATLDSSSLSIEMAGGSYIDELISVSGLFDAGIEDTSLALSFSGGGYFQNILDAQVLPHDKSFLSIAISGGKYA